MHTYMVREIWVECIILFIYSIIYFARKVNSFLALPMEMKWILTWLGSMKFYQVFKFVFFFFMVTFL